jgi:hypothetical protein
MPPRRTKITGATTPEDADQPTAPHQGILPEDLSDDVEKVLAELGETASAVIIWRMKDNKPGTWDYVTRVPASEFTVEYLKEQYGGGDYKIIIADAAQGALNPIFFSVDRRFRGKLWGDSPIPTAPSSGDTFRDQMLQLLLVRTLEPPKKETSDIDLVLRVVEAMRNSAPTRDTAAEVATIMTTATTLAGMMNPPEGFAAVASQVLPIVNRLTSAPAPAQVPAPRRIAASAQTPAPNPPPPPPSPTPHVAPASPTPSARIAGSIVPKWLTPFQALAGTIPTLADRGSDPTLYADTALDYVQDDEPTFVAAVEAMNEGRLLDDLYALAPTLKDTEARKQFAATLVERIEAGLRELLNTEATDDDDTGNDTGSDTNDGTDETATHG